MSSKIIFPILIVAGALLLYLSHYSEPPKEAAGEANIVSLAPANLAVESIAAPSMPGKSGKLSLSENELALTKSAYEIRLSGF
jgi:hypothetical protein